VFGHRHLPLELNVEGKALYINLGDWLRYNSYAVFDGSEMHLKYYK
jgi:UDP-2,3-diacylglucosamine hydrolase